MEILEVWVVRKSDDDFWHPHPVIFVSFEEGRAKVMAEFLEIHGQRVGVSSAHAVRTEDNRLLVLEKGGKSLVPDDNYSSAVECLSTQALSKLSEAEQVAITERVKT